MNVKYKKYIDYIINDIELPYLKYLNMYGLSDNEMDLVLSKVFNQPVTIEGNYVYNTNGKLIYHEDSNGYWYKREYDSNGKVIYYEDSDGYWNKSEYDQYGNNIYSENSDGDWYKREYDDNGNRIYYEDSDGYWDKKGYDTNGNQIYYEDSEGNIVDNR